MSHTVTVLPVNKTIVVEDGANLRGALIENGMVIKSACGGFASCGQCVVVVSEGITNLNDPTFEEKQLLGNVAHLTFERLSCQTKVFGDLNLDITIHEQTDAVVKKASPIKRRSRDEYEKIVEVRKENSANREERQGGFKKPKAFGEVKDDYVPNIKPEDRKDK